MIRHGVTEWNIKKMIQGTIDVPLNEEGLRQARAVSQRLAGHYSIDVIYSSPSSRALSTAHCINEKYSVDLKVDHNLIEIDFGSLSSHSLDDLEAA